MRLRSVFVVGCITLALPGLAASGFHAVQARTAWLAAQTAAHGTQAAGEVMRATALLMVERDSLQEAAFAVAPKLEMLVRAEAESDAALIQTELALQETELATVTVEQTRDSLAQIRSRAGIAMRKGSGLRAPVEQYTRLIEGLEEEVSRVERRITLASPSVGIVVGLARTANELREVVDRRGVVLNRWFSGQDLAPAQKDELLSLNGRLAGTWDRLQSGIRTSIITSTLVNIVAVTNSGFFGREEPWYRELVKAAVADAERPLSYAQYRSWHVAALANLLPLCDALIGEAEAQSETAISVARRGLLAATGIALVSLALVVAAVLALLGGLVEPVRSMTTTMTALAAGDVQAPVSARSRLCEISAMAAAVAVFRDNVISLHQREAELQKTNVQFTAALENMSQGLAMYDADERLVVYNRRFCEVNRLPPEQVQPGMTYQDVIALGVGVGNFPGRTEEQAYAERRDRIARSETGSYYDEQTGDWAIAVRYEPMAGGGWVATFEDVTERRASEAQIVHMAHHDALTGLPNRMLFREHMERVLPRVHWGGSAAIHYLDLDGFKSVNDTLGHPVGDELLRMVARRLRDATREADLVARLGGDEFAIIQVDAEHPTEVAALADRLVKLLGTPFDLEGHLIEIGTSIGIVLADKTASTSDELLRNADIALYLAKARGRGTWCFFESGMDVGIQQRRQLETDLRHALMEEQFEVYYQPLVKARTQVLTGFEALIRWHHPERGMVSPAEFIPLAEEIGFIRTMGAWVLNKACSDAAKWPEHIKVAVNLSPVQFTDGKLVQEVERTLAVSGLAANRLELEITESVLLQDNDATLGQLHHLHGLGVRISMDDFGTGYSSLSYLRRFPFNKIKIDQSFVRNLAREKGSIEIIRAVVGLGKALGMDVLAEGVENTEQLGILQVEGCDELQGYLFSRPRPLQAVDEIIADYSIAKDSVALGPTLVIDNTGSSQAIA